jgi:hypothetical protein
VNPLKFKDLTAPGYFNFRSTALQTTKNLIAWFDACAQDWVDQENLMDSFFRQWLFRDYSTATIPRTPYVAYQLNRWGLSSFLGSDTQAAALVGLVSRSYSKSISENILFLFEKLSQVPFLWCLYPPQIVFGTLYPSFFAESFIIYSNSGSLPATPAPTAYTPRAWSPPAGWTMFGSASTYISRGYLSAGTIVWMAPVSTSTVFPYYQSANLAGLPASPVTGSIGSVNNDGSGDYGAIYYFDGTTWQKNSAPNANQGQLNPDGSIPTPQPRTVWSPNPDTTLVTSNTKPPVSGRSQGYGMYGGYGDGIVQTGKTQVILTLTADGLSNLGMIINLLRRVKPMQINLSLYYTVQGSPAAPVLVTIKDSRSPN